jgi:hypothetical protein
MKGGASRNYYHKSSFSISDRKVFVFLFPEEVFCLHSPMALPEVRKKPAGT